MLRKTTFTCLLTIILMLTMSGKAYSQDIGFPSPTAANLGKYADRNVNLSAGTPNIQVPIYSLGAAGLGLDINLVYDARGIKVSEIPDWVGAGWALHAGGVITRKVKGIPDERPGYGYLDMESELNGLSTALGDGLDSGDDTYYSLVDEMYDKIKDAEPDMFYYNISGRTGKFILGHDGDDPSTIPLSNWKIDYTIGFETIDSLTMTAPDGLIYTFGKAEHSLRQPGTTPTTAEYGTAWYLTKVELPNSNREITLSYYPTTEVVHKYNNEVYELINGPGSSANQFYYQLHNRTYLKEINTQSHKIVFNREYRTDAKVPSEWNTNPGGNQEYRLTSIDIKTASNDLVKSYHMSYDYYADRLFLTGVHQEDANANAYPGYEFDYINPSGLPGRLSKAIDHWGYYNGATGNTGFISSVYWYDTYNNEERYYVGANREVDTLKSQYGVLDLITFPTGGSVTYEYEQNRYSDVYYNPDIVIGNMNFTDYRVVHQESLSSQAQIESEQFNDDGLEPVLVALNMSYMCQGSYVDHYGIYVSDISNSANEAYIIIDETGNVNTTCSEFQSQHGQAPAKNIDEDLVLNEGYNPGNTFAFDFNQKGAAYEGDDYVTMSYTVSGLSSFREKNGPGLRVRQVTVDDGLPSSPDIVKTYEYTSHTDPYPFNVGTGVIYTEPRYVRSFFDPYGSGEFSNVITGLTAAESLTFGSGERGFAGYTQVTESITGNGDVKKTFYGFGEKTNLANTILNDFEEFYFGYNNSGGQSTVDLLNINANIGQYNGKVKTAQYFNDSGTLLKKMEFIENDTDDDSNHPYKTYFGLAFDTKNTGSTSVPYLQPYNLVLPFLANTEVTETTYGGGNNIQVSTTYMYERSPYLKTKTIETNSSGQQRIREYTYAHEVTDDGAGTNYTTMSDENMFTQLYSVTTRDSSQTVLSKRWTLWKKNNNNNSWWWQPLSEWVWTGGDPDIPVFNPNN